jgi:hypothetical protein
METTSGLFETGNHEMNDHIKPAGVGAIVVAVLFIAGCKPLSQEREFSTTREPVTTRNVEAKEPETRPTLYEELQEPKAEPGSSQPTEVDRPRIRKEISDFKATTRPTGSIGAAILKVNRDNLSSQDILTRIRSELESTAMTFNEEVYYRRAEEMIMMATRDLISETLLYQEIAARIPEDQDPAIVKAVDKEVAKLANHEAGGSTVRLEKILAEQGSTLEALRMQLRKQLVTQQYLRERMKPKVVVTRDEMWSYYQKHIDEFHEPAKVHLSLIELDVERELDDGVTWSTANEEQKKQAWMKVRSRGLAVQERLKAGEDFSVVAKEVSTAASGKLGGTVGWISQGSYRLKALEEKAFSMKANAISEPIEIDSKLYILKVSEINEGKAIDFSTAQEQVKSKLEQELYRKLVIEHLSELWRKSQIDPVDEFMDAVYSRLPDYETIRNKALSRQAK